MKAYIKMLGSICVTYIITTLCITFLGNWLNYDELLLDDYISVEIIRENEQTEYYDSNKFSMLNRGDKLIATINIPKSYEVEEPTLCFHTYNCQTSLFFEGEEIYRFGDELVKAGAHIGTLYEEALIPKEAIGKSLILECVANENQAMNQLTDVTIMNATESAKAVVVNNLFEMMMFITIFLVACLVLFMLSFSNARDKIVRMGIWIALFSLLLSIYILSSRGLLNVFINSPRTTANLEYISLFALPIPFSAYFYEMYNKTKAKKVLGGIMAFYVLFFALCTVLNYTTVTYHYCRFLVPLHVSMVVGILVYVVLSFMKSKDTELEEWASIIRNGVVVLLVVGLIDVFRFNLNQFSDMIVFKLTLLPMGMIVMIVSLLMGTMMQLVNRYKEREEKRQLERLAYIDIMTGLSNRAKFYAYIDGMKEKNSWEYTIVYIDLNHLKFINDKYGHELGDQYIKLAASVMQSCFKEADVISRFGGDEFVVLYDKKCKESTETLLNCFREEMENLNKRHTFPFRVQAACGAVVSTKENPLEIEEAIILADKVMYENKKHMKSLDIVSQS